MPVASSSSSSAEPKTKKRRKAPRGIDWSTAKTGRFVMKFAYVGTRQASFPSTTMALKVCVEAVLRYAGVAWQNQEAFGVNTVENELFKGLVKTCLIESRMSCDFSRCGRTDKGVHARGNYATLRLRLKPDGEHVRSVRPIPGNPAFYSHLKYTSDNTVVLGELIYKISASFELRVKSYAGDTKRTLLTVRTACMSCLCLHVTATYAVTTFFSGTEFPYIQMINRVLPDDIRVLRICSVPSDDFDARFSCKSRTYKYFFPSTGLDLEVMAEAAQRLVGQHDYRNFCRMDVEQTTNFERTIYSFEICNGDVISHAVITGSAFLWHQVRCMMEVLMLIGKGLEKPEVIDMLFDINKTPGKPSYDLADGAGLVLFDCKYDAEWFDQTVEDDEEAVAEFSRAAIAAQRDLAVLQCLAGPIAKTTEVQSRKYVPIMQRAKAPTLDERIAVAELRNSRKENSITTTDSVPSSDVNE